MNVQSGGFENSMDHLHTPLASVNVCNACVGFLELFACASSAKLAATLATYPHEVLRTRLRQTPGPDGVVKYTGIVQATRLIWAQEGYRAFYGGMTAHVMRVVPNAALLFLSYESIVWYCRKHRIFA